MTEVKEPKAVGIGGRLAEMEARLAKIEGQLGDHDGQLRMLTKQVLGEEAMLTNDVPEDAVVHGEPLIAKGNPIE